MPSQVTYNGLKFVSNDGVNPAATLIGDGGSLIQYNFKYIADNINQVSGSGFLVPSNNLSDLPNKSTARSNLGLQSVATITQVSGPGEWLYPDVANGLTVKLVVNYDFVIVPPSNGYDGCRFIIKIINTSFSDLNYSFQSSVPFNTDITAVTAVAASKCDYIGLLYNADSNVWDIVSYIKGCSP